MANGPSTPSTESRHRGDAAAGRVARDYPPPPPEIEEIRLIETVQSPYVRVSGERWALDLKR